MVRGNWQRRIEKTEARRNEAKQRKQRSEVKKAFKIMMQDMLALLDLHGDAIRHRADTSWMIHVWTDTVPSDAGSLLDMCNVRDDKAGKRRYRSGSVESEGSATKPSGGKKAHPRSKESLDTPVEVAHAPCLCRTDFFFGKCEESRSGKKGGCRHLHYSKHVKTLAQVVLASKNKEASSEAKTVLSNSEAAFVDTHVDDDKANDPSAMDMVYYFPIDVFSTDQAAQDGPLSSLIMGALAKKSCPLGSIIYFAIDSVLVFDRNRDGLIVSDARFLRDVTGAVDNSQNSADGDKNEARAASLPGSVLEYMLTFLPDTAVASCSSVCSTWHQEIGKASGFLWLHLLQRRGWPLPELTLSDQSDQESKQREELKRFREAFVAHYTAARDLNALKIGIDGLVTKRSIDERETSYFSLTSRKGTSQDAYLCVGIEVWSPNHVLVAYCNDCTLRLFSTVQRAGSCGRKICRELVCQSLDLHKNTKKRTCTIVAMGLDEEVIGALCHVTTDQSEADGFILAVLSRDDFLVGDSLQDSERLQIIDINQAVLNFLLSCEYVDHQIQTLQDFMAVGGGFEEVEVLVSQTIAACGDGRFMIEASVSIPSMEEHNDDDSDSNMNLLLRKLFLFSAKIGVIAWMGDSSPIGQPIMGRQEELMLTSARTFHGESIGCEFAVIASCSPEISVGSIEATGQIVYPVKLVGPGELRNNTLEDGWDLRRKIRRPAAAMMSRVAVADTLVQELGNGEKRVKSIISIHKSVELPGEPCNSQLCLEENVEVDHLKQIRDDHIVAVCRVYSTEPPETNQGGHWNRNNAPRTSIFAILLDLETCRELHRVCLVDDLGSHCGGDATLLRDIPIQLAIADDTVAAGVWWEGVVITGDDMRSAGESTLQLSEAENAPGSSSKKRKKKKKAPRNGGKKDGFARGMTLRG